MLKYFLSFLKSFFFLRDKVMCLSPVERGYFLHLFCFLLLIENTVFRIKFLLMYFLSVSLMFHSYLNATNPKSAVLYHPTHKESITSV